MSTETPVETLVRIAPRVAARLATSADDYRYGHRRYVLTAVLSHMVYGHLYQAMYANYVNHDSSQFRQEFYVASQIELRRHRVHGAQSMETWRPLLYATLSDDETIIDEMAKLETPEHLKLRDDPRAPNFLVHMFQLAVRGEDVPLREKISVGAQRSGKRYREEFASGTDFFSLLLARDKAGLEARIGRLAKRTGGDHPAFEGFMRTDAVLEAKICWRRGIEVRVDHPMVPMGMMPIQPLAHYHNVYDFLELGWKPPLQDRLGLLVRWIKRRLT